MKTFLFLFFISLAASSAGYAQFPDGLMPGPVTGDAYADSIFNTREILQRAGIKKIYVYQNASEKTKTYKSRTSLINPGGNVTAVVTCFPKNEPVNSEWCLYDTILYDDLGRISEMRFRDSKEYEYSKILFKYIGENEVKLFQIVKLQNKQQVDTSIDHRYFNKKGQMIKLLRIRKDRPAESSLFYYNTDGLLDSVQYVSPRLPTAFYKRNEKAKKKIIETQILNNKFRWVFNPSGQCTSVEVTTVYPPHSNYTGTLKSETNYFYNPDGTLSKVSLKRSDKMKSIMYYTYSK